MVPYTHPLLSTPVVAILTQMLLELPWNTAIISNIFPPFPSVICSNLFFYTDPKILFQKCKFDHVRLLSKGSHYAQCGSTHWCHINLLHDRDSAVFLSGIVPSSPPFHFSDSALLHIPGAAVLLLRGLTVHRLLILPWWTSLPSLSHHITPVFFMTHIKHLPLMALISHSQFLCNLIESHIYLYYST